MLDDVAPWLALGLALSLVPVLGFSTGEAPRDTHADVVGDQDAFTSVETQQVTLNSSNNYVADALTVTHRYVSGTTLQVDVNNTASSPRFVFVNDTFTLSAGESHTVQVEDTDLLHPTGTYSVDAEIEATVREDGANVGFQRAEATVSVTVE